MQHIVFSFCVIWIIHPAPCSTLALSKPWPNVSTGGAVSPMLSPIATTWEDIRSVMERTPWDPLLVWTAQTKDGAVNVVKKFDQSSAEAQQYPSVANKSIDVQDMKVVHEDRDELMCIMRKDFPVHEIQAQLPHAHTCAVVSNSGVLDLHSHGQSIDGTDAVFRFNLAPVGGKYANRVGHKETARFINDRAAQETLTDLPSDVEFDMVQHVVIVPFAEPTPEVLGDIQTFQERHANAFLLLMEQTMLKLGEQLLKKIYDTRWFHDGVSFKPTSGFVGMMFALSLCDRVHAYGMAATPSSAHAAYHYYRSDEEHTGKAANENGWHKSFPAEKDLWRRLAADKEMLDQSDWVEIPGFATLSC
eukprot:5887715-Amphidinium_carterae.1